MDDMVRFPGVQESTTIALQAYLIAGHMEAQALAEPDRAISLKIHAQISRQIGEAALIYVEGPDDS